MQPRVDALFNNAQYADSIARALAALKGANIELTQPRVDALFNNAHYADGIALALAALKDANIELTQQHVDALFKNAQYAYLIVLALTTLKRANIELTQQYFDALLNHAQYAYNIAIGLVTLKNAGIDDLMQQYLDVVTNGNIIEINNQLDNFSQANILTQERSMNLFDNVRNGRPLTVRHQILTQEEILNSSHSLKIIEHSLRIHPLILEKQPEKVLHLLAASKNLQNPVPTVVFLKDDLQPAIGTDTGGLRNQLLTELFKYLLDEDTTRTIKIQNQIPQLQNPPTENEKQSLRELGILLGECFANESMISGRIFPDYYFQLLKNPSLLKASITNHELIEMFEGFEFDDNTKLQLAIYKKPTITVEDKAFIKQTYALYPSDMSELNDKPNGFHDFIANSFSEAYRQTIFAAQIIAQGMNDALNVSQKQELQNINAADLSERIQGTSFNRETIANCIKYEGGFGVVIEKVKWLKEKIKNPNTDKQWVEKFLFAVTGYSCITTKTKITIADTTEYNCMAHTCYAQLDVPTVHTDVGSDVGSADLTCEQKFFNNLQLVIDTGSHFDML